MSGSIDQYDQIFKSAGEEWDIDPTVLKALVMHESGGRADAKGAAGEIGLGQLMPDTARGLGVTNRYDPEQSIYGAAKYLSEALQAEGDDPTKALRYYNGGPKWRNSRNPNNAAYPGYVGGQYAKLAKADTGSMTDATPVPAKAPPEPAQGKSDMATSVTADGSSGGDDAFTRALKAPDKPSGQGAQGGAAAEPDAFSRALAVGASEGAPRGGVRLPGDEGPAPSRTPPTPAPGQPGAYVTPSGSTGFSAPPAGSVGVGADAAPSSGVPADEVPTRIREAARSAFLNAPSRGTEPGNISVLSTGMQDWINRNLPGIGPYVLNPLGQIAGTAIGAGAAAGVAGVQTVNELLREAGLSGPLQRDLNMLAASAPMVAAGPEGMAARAAMANRPAAIAAAPPPETPPPAPAPVNPLAARVAEVGQQSRPPLGPDGKPMSAEAQAATRYAEAPDAEAGEGGSVGAKAVTLQPKLNAGMDAKEIAAHQKTAEGQKLMEGQIPNEQDTKVYITGNTANLAEQEQTATAARELKGLGLTNTKVAEEINQAASDNAQRRVQYYRDTAGTQHDFDAIEREREADIKTDKATVFDPGNVKGPVDQAPITAKIREILDTPENRQNAHLQATLRPLLDKLEDAEGKGRIADPREMWGLRQEIDRAVDKNMAAKDPQVARNLRFAGGQLNQVADMIDTQIEKVAPGYSDMVAKYAGHSRQMEAMKVLQDAEAGLLRGPGQTLSFNDFQRFMRNVVKGRNSPASDTNAFKSITPETMERLWNIRDDLRRSASAIEMAKAHGSDTVPNMMDVVKQYGKLGGVAGLHAVANFIAPGYGSFVVEGGRNVFRPFQQQRLQRQQMRRAQQMIYPPSNALNPPSAGGYP